MATTATIDDQKYVKHRHQKQQQQQHRVMGLVGVTCVVLIFTWHSLSSDLMSMQGHMDYIPPNPVMRQQHQQRHLKTVKPKATSFLEKARNLVRDSNQNEMEDLLAEMESKIRSNVKDEIRWSRPELLVSLDPRHHPSPLLQHSKRLPKNNWNTEHFFKVHRNSQTPMDWEIEPEATQHAPPRIDFTQHSYEYPDKLKEPPAHLGDYPPLEPLADIMNRWPQDDIDHPPTPFKETLIHFDYQNPQDMAAAEIFRDSKLPFKLVNVPEVAKAGLLWTDEYLSHQFDTDPHVKRDFPAASGSCQESPDNFFAFYTPQPWVVGAMGIPPTRNNDWKFHKWVRHARYADSVSLSPQQPHFYWQAGVDREERTFPKKDWTFISRDLPGLSSPTKTFFVFEPESQKGIQCRFGERGVTAATHFDAGRNMIAMVTGAKRYILSPPNQCRNLGIVTSRGSAIFRHSLLNFGHINYLDQHDTEMSDEERAWLERSGQALAIDTVLKAGEVLYIPSHWFHYITSLQKSAQCNVRSGVEKQGDAVFGGQADVTDRCEIR
jgi:hypothetical protein